MVRAIFYLIIYVLGLVLQFGWSSYLAPYGLYPNIILVALVFIGLTRGSLEAELFGFAWGLSWDVLSVDLFGSHALLFLLTGFLAGKLSRKWNESKLVSQIILTFAASILFWMGMEALYQIFSPGEYRVRVNYIVVAQPFLNVLVAPLVFAAGKVVQAPRSGGSLR